MKATTGAARRPKPTLADESLYRLTRKQYRTLLDAGILKDGEPVEFQRGLLCRKNSNAAGERLYRLSVAQYHEMIRPGILLDGDPVELLEGLLVKKMSKNPPHSHATRLLRKRLSGLLPAGWELDSQEPITTLDSEPEPDVMVFRERPEGYRDRHPTSEDLALVGEVADSSLAEDRNFKKKLYARAQVRVYWIINLVDRQIEVYSDPTGPTKNRDYRRRQVYGPADKVPVVLDGKEVGKIKVQDVLP